MSFVSHVVRSIKKSRLIRKIGKTESKMRKERNLLTLANNGLAKIKYLQFIENDHILRPILIGFGASGKDLEEIMNILEEQGLYFSLKGDYIPASAIAFPSTLMLCLSTHTQKGVEKALNWDETAYMLQQYFDS